MSNCIRLRKPDKAFAAMPFRQDIWDRLMVANPNNCWESKDEMRWVDVFACDGGTIERKGRPDRIVFYISFTTNREMRWYLSEIVKLGGWIVPFLVGDEYDNFRQTFEWR